MRPGSAAVPSARRRILSGTPTFPTLSAGAVHTRISAMQQSSTLTNGQTVTTAVDYSSNARTITASGTITYNATGLNGKPTFVFVPNCYFDVATFTTITAATAITVFAVIKAATTVNNQAFLANTSGNTILLARLGTAWGLQRGGSDVSGGTADTNPHRIRGSYPANGAATGALYVDGTQVISGASLGGGTPTTFRIGGNPSFNNWNGNISELVVCTGAITATDINNIETYLTQTWGI